MHFACPLSPHGLPQDLTFLDISWPHPCAQGVLAPLYQPKEDYILFNFPLFDCSLERLCTDAFDLQLQLVCSPSNSLTDGWQVVDRSTSV